MTTPNQFCGECGSRIADATDAFCPKCGLPYAASVAATPDEPSLAEPTPVDPTVTSPEEASSTPDAPDEPVTSPSSVVKAPSEPLPDKPTNRPALYIAGFVGWIFVAFGGLGTASTLLRNTDNVWGLSYWGVMNVTGTLLFFGGGLTLARWCGRKLGPSFVEAPANVQQSIWEKYWRWGVVGTTFGLSMLMVVVVLRTAENTSTSSPSASSASSARTYSTATPTPRATATPAATASNYYQLGTDYLKQDDYQKAIEQYDHAIRLDPEYANAYYNRGNAYGAMGKSAEAARDFAKAKELGL